MCIFFLSSFCTLCRSLDIVSSCFYLHQCRLSQRKRRPFGNSAQSSCIFREREKRDSLTTKKKDFFFQHYTTALFFFTHHHAQKHKKFNVMHIDGNIVRHVLQSLRNILCSLRKWSPVVWHIATRPMLVSLGAHTFSVATLVVVSDGWDRHLGLL